MSDVVYYLRRGDLIKIGWTGNLKARMRALRPDELLAVEPRCETQAEMLLSLIREARQAVATN